MASPQELNAATERALAMPDVQRILKAWQDFKQRTGVSSSRHGVSDYELQLKQTLESMLPKGTYVLAGPDGNLEIKNKGIPSWVYPVAIGAAIGTAGLATGAFGAAAGAGAAGANAASAMSVPELGVGAIPSVLGPGVTESASAYPFLGGAAAAGAGGVAKGLAKDVAGSAGEEAPAWLKAALAGLSGLPGLMNTGPSDEERAYQAQMQRLLGQQEQRTQFQNPLYEATTRMAFGLLPNMGNGGNPYPLNSLSDVNVPSLEDLIAKQRR